jgi:hypothetical protein
MFSQTTAVREMALKWREDWRAEVAPRTRDGQADGNRLSPPSPRPAKQTAEFARALARAEFGRFYWSDEPAGQLIEGFRKVASNKKGHKVKQS